MWEIYIFMDKTVEIEGAEQNGSISKAVSRTGSSDPYDPCCTQKTPRNKIPAQISKS
jgi:hypothetical protein